ncbi:MAG: hypothetical protein IPM24_20630 [Bryobacterales bacterium]|jgi:hypothetical protein|nr:hypothetical protein [Bryobacterales bacterium]
MIVRIRLGRGPVFRRKKGKNRHLALGFGALLTPAAVIASIFGLWRLAADLQIAQEFGISTGLFSHWQVWLTVAALLQWGAWMLNRYGSGSSRGEPS